MQSLKKLWQRRVPEGKPVSAGSAFPELSLLLESLDQWKSAVAAYPFLFAPAYIEDLVGIAKGRGVDSVFFREHIPAQEVSVPGSNYRESLSARGLNPRLRAVLDLLSEEAGSGDVWNYTIYAPEALTPFALVLRGRFPRFIGSEYVETPEQRKSLFPVQFEDLGKLSFEDTVFDCVISNEVFEHIPDLTSGIREICRVLKPSGVLIATFPFGYNQLEHVIKARLTGGAIEYLATPEYHGNPVDPERGSLVFQIPGWSVLEDCRAAGFRHAEIVFVSSPQRGITGAELAGVHILRCRK